MKKITWKETEISRVLEKELTFGGFVVTAGTTDPHSLLSPLSFTSIFLALNYNRN